MELLELMTGGAIGAIGLKVIYDSLKEIHEDKKRKNTPCDFSDSMSASDFSAISKNAGKGIKRLTALYVKGAIVYGTVRSQSGLTHWFFQIDYNDYGRITGKYWLSSDNHDSKIPMAIADKISLSIKQFYKNIEESSEKNSGNPPPLGQSKHLSRCPYCGKSLTAIGAKFCSYCGMRIRVDT